jgi:hypothetical protein
VCASDRRRPDLANRAGQRTVELGMPHQHLRREDPDERRSCDRFPIEREVKYKIFGSQKNVIGIGLGRSLNISSSGVLFTTESNLPAGQRVELAVSWPALLNDVLPLKLVASGRLVRSQGRQAAMAIDRYEFKTRGAKGL